MIEFSKPLTPRNRILLTDALGASRDDRADDTSPPVTFKDRLRSALAEGDLQSWIQNGDGRQEPIPPFLWAGMLLWEFASFLPSVSVSYAGGKIEGHVLLDRTAFQQWLCDPAPKEIIDIPTVMDKRQLDALPYLKYMLELVDTLNLRTEKLAKRSILQDEIRGRWPKNLKLSENKVRAIATLLSDPEGEKGGNRPGSHH